MSLVTFEVEIDHGRVISHEREALPDRGTGLLTLLPAAATGKSAEPGSVLEFIGKWAGAFVLPQPEAAGDDARLAYLLGKHAK